MIEAHLSLLDACVLGVMLLSCLFAFFRGFVREILSLSAWIGAGIVTIYYFPAMAEKLQPHFKSAVVAAGFGTLGIFMAALIGFSILNMFILKFVKSGSDVGLLDNVLGLGFGALRGALIISLGFFLVSISIPEDQYPDWLKKSITRPYGEKGAMMLAKIAPDYLRDISSLEKKMEARAKGIKEENPDAQSKDSGHGYSKSSSQQINRIIESNGPSR